MNRGQGEFARRLGEIERFLNEGNTVAAVRGLRELSSQAGARRYSLEIARHWRDARQPIRALRLLHHRVYRLSGGRHEKLAIEDTDACFEYAASLVLAGAAREGLRILARIPASEEPRIARQTYLATVRLWQQEMSIAGLRHYLELPGLERHQPQIARIELADCHLYGLDEPDACWRILDEVESEIARGGYEPWLALGLTQIRLQAAYARGDRASVRALVKRLRGEFRVQENNPWVAAEARMYELLERASRSARREAAGLRRSLDDVRGRFRELGRWEFARQCDAYWAIATRDRAELARVYFSSPLEAFRRKLVSWAERAWGERAIGLPPGQDLAWGFRLRSPRLRWVIDLRGGWVLSARDGRMAPGQSDAKCEGRLPQLLLAALASDAYRTMMVTELHEAVYPGVPFDPVHGAARIHRIMARLRRWMAKVPALRRARISEADRRYQLVLPSDVGVRAYRSDAPAAAVGLAAERLARLRERLGGRDFSPAEARLELGASERSVRRFLADCARAGLLTRRVAGPATWYRFA